MQFSLLFYLQSNEVGGSYHMEKEGLIRSVEKLQGNGLIIRQLITDRHRSIAKWIREELPHVMHYYDVVNKWLTIPSIC